MSYFVSKSEVFKIIAWWIKIVVLGASKVAYYTAQNFKEIIKGLILLSPADMIGLTQDNFGKKTHEICIKQAEEFVKNGTPDLLLNEKLWGFVQLSAGTYLNLFGRDAKTRVFEYANDKSWEIVNKIRIPVIAFTGTEDEGVTPVIDPDEAMKRINEELKSSPRVETSVFQNGDHDFTGLGEEICQKVIEFIRQVSL